MNGFIEVIERDNYLFWSEFARRSGAALGDDRGAIWYRSGVPFASYNGVLGVGCDVDSMLARVRAWGIHARWLISTASCGRIETDFARHELTLTDEYPAMVANVTDVPEPRLDGITVEIVTTERQRREWDDVLCEAFNLAPEASAHVAEAHAWPQVASPPGAGPAGHAGRRTGGQGAGCNAGPAAGDEGRLSRLRGDRIPDHLRVPVLANTMNRPHEIPCRFRTAFG